MNAIARITSAAALTAAAALLAAAPAAAGGPEPVPAYAQHRLDRVAAALAKDPLFVDPDMSAALDEAGRARVRAAMESASRVLGTPVYVVVIPNESESESEGRDDALLHWLHGRLRRDGLYMLVNQAAWFEEETFGVPRRLLYIDEDGTDRPADPENRFADLADRLVSRLLIVRDAPSKPPSTPRLYTTPAPFGQEDRLRTEVEPETTGPFLTGLLLAGPAGGAALFGAGVGAAAYRRRRRRPRAVPAAGAAETHPGAPAEPSVKWLRRTGGRELERLRDLLPDSAGNPGREYAVSAYDAAQILYDDAGDDPGRSLDLTGVIVLARLGRAALAQKTATPPAPCYVNPLHGPSAQSRKMQLGAAGPERHRVCAACGGQNMTALAARELKVPGPDGPRPHHTIAGVWKDTAFGADGDLIRRIQEYLGVE